MVKIENLNVSYMNGYQVLHQLNLAIQPGETVGIIGENGAGKSTLLMTLVGILMPTGGNIKVEGLEMSKKNLMNIRKKVGVVFQNPDDQLFMSNVYDDIAFGLRNDGMSETEIKQKIAKVARELGIEKLVAMNSLKLSGGEKRIIAIAGILVMEPSIMLFDEPTSFLDPKTRRRLLKLLKKLTVTKIIATHDLDMAMELCDRVVILKDGRIFTDGKAKEVLTDPVLLEEAGLELPFCLQRPV